MKVMAFLWTVMLMPILAQNNLSVVAHEEERELYDKFFDQAGSEFGVPADLLRGISFAETRWTHMKWSDEDKFSNCTGMPRVYGVMGLWDNDYFGHTLKEAAQLIGKSPQDLKESPLQNIRGAAALIKKYYVELPTPVGVKEGSIESWLNAVAKFSGFPQTEIAAKRGLEVYAVLSSGYQRDRISIKKNDINLEPIQNIVRDLEMKSQLELQKVQPDNAMNTPDYPLAKWNAAYSGNFGTQLIQQKFVVVHDVEGSYLGCISWFKNTTAQVSAHYVLNSHPNGVNSATKGPNSTPDAPVGEVTQMVEEKYRAWHVGCWNSYMIGIEHEGYASVSGWYTAECYNSSAKLVKYLCDKYNIPKDRNHVIAHCEHQNATWRNWVNSSGLGFDPTCNTHTDPGQYWMWNSFMNLVTTADTVRPVITGALPHSNINAFPAYKEIVIEFNTQMDVISTNAAFSITPNVTGTFIWNADNTKLTYDPVSLLPWNTSFVVKIDTSAKNIAKSRNLGTVPFSATFTTVPTDTVGPAVVTTYPAKDENGVSTSTDVVINLDEPVQTTSLSTTVKLVDENNANISLAGAKNETILDKGIVSFTPLNLKPNKTYTLKLLKGMKDFYSNISSGDVFIQFTTSPEVFSPGVVIDNMDGNTKGWLQPYQSARSKNIDTTKTTVSFSAEKIKGGSGAIKLSYQFTSQDGGVIELKAGGFPPLDFYSTIGLWIAGDASKNSLELHFSPNDQVLSIGKVYWRGWKFVRLPLASLIGPNKILTSIIVKQDSGFVAESKLYFDEMQIDAVISGIDKGDRSAPDKYFLEQNYPNPFNPSTNITFSIEQSGPASLKVHDLLGRAIVTLIDEVIPSGKHQVTFAAGKLPSGIYYYTLRAGSFTQTRKMILLK